MYHVMDELKILAWLLSAIVAKDVISVGYGDLATPADACVTGSPLVNVKIKKQ